MMLGTKIRLIVVDNKPFVYIYDLPKIIWLNKTGSMTNPVLVANRPGSLAHRLHLTAIQFSRRTDIIKITYAIVHYEKHEAHEVAANHHAKQCTISKHTTQHKNPRLEMSVYKSAIKRTFHPIR